MFLWKNGQHGRKGTSVSSTITLSTTKPQSLQIKDVLGKVVYPLFFFNIPRLKLFTSTKLINVISPYFGSLIGSNTLALTLRIFEL